MENPTKVCGLLLKLTAAGHTAYGLVWYRDEIKALIGQNVLGLLPVVEHRFREEAVVFFFLVSPLLCIAAALTDFAHRRLGELPRSVGWWLFFTGLALFALAPLSGAVLGIGQGLLWLHAARGRTVDRLGHETS